MANKSAQLFANTSLAGSPQFAYVVPYSQTQTECNIYGPICQTGPITVDVKLGLTSAATVLPCSSYLSVQSTNFGSTDYLSLYQQDSHSKVLWSDDWPLNFGRSPECRSYAQAYRQGQYTISSCGSQNTIIQTISNPGDLAVAFWQATVPSQIPPGVLRYFAFGYTGTCCGDCSLDVSEVRLYYFPNRNSTDCGDAIMLNTTSTQDTLLEKWIHRTMLKSAWSLGSPLALVQSSDKAASPYRKSKQTPAKLNKRMQSLVGNGSIVVTNGHTFTSPSVYLEIIGTAAVNDECGGVGPTLTNPLITFPPGKLSTWKPPDPTEMGALHLNFGIGEIWKDPNSSGADGLWGKGIIGTVEPLNVDDLACPTWGLGKTTFVNGTVRTTIGSPYLPLMIPDMHAFTLDPTWARLCTGVFTGLGRLSSFAILDPPHPLTPASRLVPVPTRIPTPANTYADPTLVLDTKLTSSMDPARPANPFARHQKAPTNTYDSSETGIKMSRVTHSSNSARPALSSKSQAGMATTTDHAKAEPGKLPLGPLATNVIQSNGEPVFSTFPVPPDIVDTSASDSKVLTIKATEGMKFDHQHQRIEAGGQILSIVHSSSELSTPTYSPDEPATNMPDRVFTLVSQPHSKNDNIDNGKSSLLDVLKITGYTTAPNPSEIVIYGFSVVPGEKTTTISRIATTDSPSGSLILASFSTTVAPQHPATIGTQIFSVYQNGLEVTGADFDSGSAQTINDTVLSSGHSRALSSANTDFLLALATSTQPRMEDPTVAGPAFPPSPSALPIAATTITAGGSAITLYGTVVSLRPLGNLVVGSSTISLSAAAASATSSLSALVIDVPIHSSLVVVDGQTLTSGADGIAVPGGVVNIESGTRTMSVSGGHSVMPTSSVHATISAQTLQSGQADIAPASLCLVLWLWAGVILLLR